MERNNSIQIRKIETDVIKNFVNYAKMNGSRNANMYFVNFTKLVYSTFNIKSGERDFCTPEELSIISTSEMIINKELKASMAKNMFYKDIYQRVKKRIKEFSILMKK